MAKPSRPPEPRLAWAYVRERAATTASVPLPDLGPESARSLPTADGEVEPHRLTPVSAWAHLKPRARPLSYCPVCLEPVLLKLGQRLRHHYAHSAESTCRAATPEGALHLAAKLHLAHELQPGGTELVLQRLCHRVPADRSTERCSSAPPHTLRVIWDEVRVEHALPSLRADLLLLRAGEPVLAVEVYASHAVDEEKGEKYRSLELPWVEISARQLLPDSGIARSGGGPLPVLGDSDFHPERWRCTRHATLYQAYQEYQRTGVHRLAWRIVHLYRSDGGRSASETKVDSLVIWMMERREEGRVVEAWLERGDRDAPLSPPIAVDGRDDARRLLHRAFREWARWTRRARSAIIDSPMTWSEGTPPPAAEGATLFPQRLRMDAHAGTFIGAPGLPRLAWPAPLFAEAASHPVLGFSPVYWTDLPVRDQGAVLNAVVGTCWLTLRPHEWTSPGAGSSHARADISLFHHDGRRWKELRHAAFSYRWDGTGGGSEPSWGEILLGLADVAAEHGAELAARKVSLEALALPLLQRQG